MTVAFLVSLLSDSWNIFYYSLFREFAVGFRDSLYGFSFVQKLGDKQSIGLAQKCTKDEPTVLQKRRLMQQTEEERQCETRTVESIQHKKASGLKLVFQCIIVNLIFTMALHFLIFPVFHWIYELADIGWIPTFTLMIYFKQCLMFTFNVVCCSVYIPLYLFMKLFNSLWCLDVSNAALRYANIRTKKFQTFSQSIGDLLVGLLVEFLFMIQIWVVTWIGFRTSFFTQVIWFIHYSLLYSLFSFEYVWSAKGIKIGSRLDFIERNWPYYMGFGALLAAIGIIFTQFIISYLIFGMCFPFFIISAYVTDSSKHHGRSSIPSLRLFWPSLIVANHVSNLIANAIGHCFAKEVKKTKERSRS